MRQTDGSMQGKVCVVTGANSGIGKATALGLASLDATLLLVCRDKQRGETAREEIIHTTGNPKVELYVADLSTQRSIRTLVHEVTLTHPKLHVLINNAGVHHLQRRETPDGFEANFAVNYLAPFLLTNLLLDRLKSSAPSRVINVSTRLIQHATLDFDDLQSQRRYRLLKKGALAYCQSKLALTLFTYELANRLHGTNVTVNCYCPGWTRTPLLEDEPRPFTHWLLSRVLAQKPLQGARTAIFLASSAAVEGVTGKFYENCHISPTFQSCYDPEVAQRLWEISEQLVHLHG